MTKLDALKSLVTGWTTYDPSWIIALAQEQLPDETWLPAALARCTAAHRPTMAYVRFVSGANPNQPGSEWQFERNLILEHPEHGEVVLDVLRDGRIGGIEMWKYMLSK